MRVVSVSMLGILIYMGIKLSLLKNYTISNNLAEIIAICSGILIIIFTLTVESIVTKANKRHRDNH